MTQTIPCQKTNLICSSAKLHALDLPLIYSNLGVCPQKIFLNCISISQLNIFWECVHWRRDRVRIVIQWENALSKLCRLQTRLATASQRPVFNPLTNQRPSWVSSVKAVMVRCMKITFSRSVQNKNCKHITLLVYICSQLRNCTMQQEIVIRFEHFWKNPHTSFTNCFI